MYYWISEIVTLAGVIIALIIGKRAWATPKKALFPKLVAAGLGCMALGCLHDTIYLLVTGNYADNIYIGYLGVVGCFLFLISASFGQLDGIFDDRSVANLKYRIMAFISPIAIILLFIPSLRSDRYIIAVKIIDFIGWIPIIIASYFNTKHAIIPDGGFAFVRAVRPYNIVAVIFEFAEVLYLSMYTLENQQGVVICSAIIAVSACFLMHFARKGAEKWTI